MFKFLIWILTPVIKAAAWIYALFGHIARYNKTIQIRANMTRAAAMRLKTAKGKNQRAQISPQPVKAKAKPMRNAPCFCGSGKKYKYCHGGPNK